MSSVVQRADGSMTWEQVEVKLLAEVKRANGWYRVLKVNNLDIYVSPSGKTRVFRNGRELVDQKVHENAGERRTCEVCHKWILVRADGELRIHGKRMDGGVCPGGATVRSGDIQSHQRRLQRNGAN